VTKKDTFSTGFGKSSKKNKPGKGEFFKGRTVFKAFCNEKAY
jgi:hypothetical protein